MEVSTSVSRLVSLCSATRAADIVHPSPYIAFRYMVVPREGGEMMREPTYFILAALLDGPLHGYGIIKRAQEMSGGRVRLAVGTLYSGLDRLAGEGLVEVVGEEIVNGRARRSYALTGSGAAALGQEARRMAEAARMVQERLAPTPAGGFAPPPNAHRSRPAPQA